MAKKKAPAAVAEPAPPARKSSPHLLAVALLAFAVLVFHWEPMFSAQASIQWDAVDVHYSAQKYFSDHVREGRLPYWTPYIFSGYPFLADPQVGAWYPLNWPFFLLGITPGAIQAELALHSLIAALGAYFFAFRKLDARQPALTVALAYALSGYFAGHASHVGIFQAASWLGWILLATDRGIAERSAVWRIAAGLFTGVMILAGHFQTALYIGLAAACYAGWLIVERRDRWKAALVTLAAAGATGAAVSAVMVIPGIELLSSSVRSGADFGGATNSPLVAGAMGTLVYPNLFGVFSDTYKGPADITQYYFYAGILLLPLAVFGCLHRTLRWPALALALPALWYAFGPAAGLYSLLTLLPGLGSVRAPVHIWFVVAFGLALLAGAGLTQVTARWKHAAWVVPALLFADLFWFNSATNRLTYARASFAELYGNGLAEFTQRIGGQLPELTRFHAPHALPAFGPQNHPLDARVPATYGYNPLRLSNYNAYLSRAEKDPTLLAVLGAKFRLNPSVGGVEASDAVLPRVTIAPGGSASVVEYDEGFYRIRYRADAPAVVRVAEVWYPGWRAEASGRELDVKEVDVALIGISVPAGEGEFALRFRTRRFEVAAGVSLGAMLAACASILLARRRARLGSRAG